MKTSLSLRIAKRSGLAALVGMSAAIATSAQAIVIETNSFTMGLSSTLNVQDNALIIHNVDSAAALAKYAEITAQLNLGINLANSGWWDGVGDLTGGAIQSSNAALTAADNTKGIGAIINDYQGSPVTASFFGVTVGLTDILLRFTWMGDADLDGFVTPTDQFLLDDNVSNNGNTLTGWLNGDFDWQSDNVTPTDQFVLDQAVIIGGADVNAPLAGGGKFSGGVVPEPGSIALLAIGALGLLNRRGGRKNS